MTDQPPQASGSQPQTSGLVIPPEVQQKFSPLLAFIKGSESMNDEERQYWINILPIMTPEQLKNLEEILMNEKQQLAAIDAKYSKEMTSITATASVASIGQKIRSQKQEREKVESRVQQSEEVEEEEILQRIQAL